MVAGKFSGLKPHPSNYSPGFYYPQIRFWYVFEFLTAWDAIRELKLCDIGPRGRVRPRKWIQSGFGNFRPSAGQPENFTRRENAPQIPLIGQTPLSAQGSVRVCSGARAYDKLPLLSLSLSLSLLLYIHVIHICIHVHIRISVRFRYVFECIHTSKYACIHT